MGEGVELGAAGYQPRQLVDADADADADSIAAQGHALTVLWLAFVAFMTLRGMALGWRARDDAWPVTRRHPLPQSRAACRG